MVVDSSALVAILLGEPEGDALALALAGAAMPVICAPNWLEAMMVISAPARPPGGAGLGRAAPLHAAEVQIEPADADLAQTAFDAWQRFGKGRHPAGLNFGDCLAYALTSRRGDALLFKAKIFRQPTSGVLLIGHERPLPVSRGGSLHSLGETVSHSFAGERPPQA